MSVVQLLQHLERFLDALARVGEAFFLEHVKTADAEVTDVVADEARNIVIPDQQQIHRHIPSVPEQLVLAAGKAQATALEQRKGSVGKPAGLLYGDAYACLGIAHNGFLLSMASL